MDVTAKLAKFVTDLNYEAIPRKAVETAKIAAFGLRWLARCAADITVHTPTLLSIDGAAARLFRSAR